MTPSAPWFRRFSVLVLAALCFARSDAQTPTVPRPLLQTVEELRTRLDEHVTQPRFSGGLWGVKIVSLDSGRTVYEHHADRLMSPASNTKLYTGALALDQLGGDHRIVTPIFAAAKPDRAGVVQGDVIVSGRGDPSWKTRGASGAEKGAGKNFWSTFEPFVAMLDKAGVRRITGDIVADATWWRGVPQGAGWTADDLNEYYGAEISAISLEDNYAELRLTPGAKAGDPCGFAVLQPHTGLVIDNRATTAAAGGRRKIEVTRVVGEKVVHVFGELPVGDKEEVVDLPVPRPASWFAAALREALTKRGIVVEGGARSVRWPEASPVGAKHLKLGEITSPTMRELVAGFMKPSQNLETDLIFAQVGERRRAAQARERSTTEELGVLALQEFLTKHGLPAEDVRFEEGSGLSRNNLTTANATVALLTFMAAHREANAFADSLPIAGVDGSLRRRMAGTAAEGNVRAKTGTLRYAASLSGYVTTAAGERLAFALMLNRVTAQGGRRVTAELDDIAVWLAGLAGRSDGVGK
jgi:D-alanyl-D-alanine carboxypeptidase/D-alanyl-D-alanine-endopeptidase (penicillin-binding protein 4)